MQINRKIKNISSKRKNFLYANSPKSYQSYHRTKSRRQSYEHLLENAVMRDAKRKNSA